MVHIAFLNFQCPGITCITIPTRISHIYYFFLCFFNFALLKKLNTSVCTKIKFSFLICLQYLSLLLKICMAYYAIKNFCFCFVCNPIYLSSINWYSSGSWYRAKTDKFNHFSITIGFYRFWLDGFRLTCVISN